MEYWHPIDFRIEYFYNLFPGYAERSYRRVRQEIIVAEELDYSMVKSAEQMFIFRPMREDIEGLRISDDLLVHPAGKQGNYSRAKL